ncbi:MAG: Crp/Fnr family transcriptional regulator [Eubacteriales bacterium]|nr:Crp/Fnr family transcriptional regulator [Eubacteriales bacterium]
MEKYLPILTHTQMFAGVNEQEISAMLHCLNASLRTYKKGEYIFHQGDQTDSIMLLVEGKLHIQRDDFWGNSNIINVVEVGEMFGEAYAAPDSGVLLNNVIAAKDSAIMLFDAKRVITTCSSACRFHSMVVQNLFFALSEKNRKLVQKLGHMANRSTRQKLISYLSDESARQNSSTFTVPFTRQQMADYLSVDRSAMSSELGRMRDEGLIKFEKNNFTLLQD